MAVDSERDYLAPFYIEKVEGLDSWEPKNAGAFGSVYQVIVNGFPCIAKRLHDILVGPSVRPEERSSISGRFREECILLSRLRHPNIVQFIGVHRGKSENDLTLLMEGLYMDLEKCLTVHTSIPLPCQLTILLDVAYGLLYLHSQTPPIIHRDLKANNVLLTTNMTAKLADLGVSKILDAHPLSEVVCTMCPGTPGVMPPEALIEKPTYTTKLDGFSFGTLILHIVNHEFPMPFETDKFVKGKQHIAKRKAGLKKMGEAHCLYQLVVRCLLDNPKKRPTMNEITSVLKQLSKNYPKKFEDMLQMYEEICKVEITLSGIKNDREALTKQLLAEEEKCSKIELSLQAKEGEWREFMAEQTTKLEQMNMEVETRKSEAKTYMEDLATMQQQKVKMADLHLELDDKLEAAQRELEVVNSDCNSHKQRLAEVEVLNQRLEEELKSAMKEVLVAREENIANLSQVNQYKKELDLLKTQVAELRKHKKNLSKRMEWALDNLARSEEEAKKLQRELKKANEKLKRKVSSKGSKGLEEKVTELEDENEKLYDTVEKLHERIKKLVNKQQAPCTKGSLIPMLKPWRSLPDINSHGQPTHLQSGFLKTTEYPVNLEPLVTLPHTDLPANKCEKSQEKQPASTEAPVVHTTEEALNASGTSTGPEEEWREVEEGDNYVNDEEQPVAYSAWSCPFCEQFSTSDINARTDHLKSCGWF